MANEYSINAKITADSSSFQKNIKDASTTLGSFAKEIRSVTELIGSLFVSQKFINFAKTSINAIEEERKETELLGKTLQITGANAWTTQKQLVDMATAFEQQSNFTQEQIERAQTVMLGFKSVTKDVFDSAMQNVLDMSTVMGMDLVSAVQTVGKALDDPIKGLGSLQRQGFAFSESQKAMLADMVATGNRAKAQKIILDELATTYGGAAKAGQNAFQQLDIAIGNLQKSIGSTLTPVVESITKDITALVNQFNTLDKGTQAFILTAGSLLTTLPLIIKGVQALKIALVSLQTSVPILLAISAAVVGISAAVAHVSKENEIDKFSRELSETQKSADNLLNAFAKGNPAKKLDADVTKELIKLYPELSGKIDEYGTSVEEAAKKVKEIATDKMVEKMALPIAKYRDLLSQAKDDLYESKRIIESGGKDSAQMAREYLEYYRANLAKANDEMKKINEQLKSVGKMLSPEGEVINIPVRFTPHADIEELKKSWKELLREVFVISDDFSTGKQAANIFITKMSDSLKNDRRIAEALGESFDMAKVLEEQKSKILEAIKDILKSKEKIDKPFSIDELAKADTALGTLAKQYKALSEEIKQYTIANTEWTDKLLEQDIKILEKKRDNAVAVAKNEKKTEQEIYEIKVEYTDKINALQVKQLEAQRQTEIKKVKISKESLESQKAIIAQINQYYDTQIAAIKETTVVINKSSNAWDNYLANFKKQAEDWNTVTVKMAEVGSQAMGDMFQQIGQDLANGGVSFENYSAIAVQAISQVLVALSAQISALGVTHALTLDFAGAALAAAGAAAALAAAGALGAVAKNMKSTAEETSAVTAALEEFIKLLNELRSGKLTSSEFASSFVSLRKIVKDTNDYLYKSVELFANVQEKYSKFDDIANRKSAEDMAKLGHLKDTLEDVKDNLYLAIIKQSLALDSYNKLLSETIANQKKEIESGKELSDMYQTLYSDINKFYELLKNEQMIQVQGLRTSLLESMASLGADIGKMLVDGIKSGASKSDFAESLKELIREKMIEIAVYTEQFQNVLADAGTKLMSGIAGGDDSLIQQAKEQIEALYDTAVQTAETVDKKLSSIFKSIKSTAKSATNSIAESMKSVSESAVTSLRNLAGSQKQINTLLSGLKTQSKSWETVHKVSTTLLKSTADSAKTTLEAAKKNLETQQKALDNASKKLNDSKAKLATAQQNLALSPYYGNLGIAIASQAYNQALVEQTAALSKYEKAEQKKNEAQQKSNSAQLAYNNALSAYEEKLAEINPYLSQINEAENKYNALISETKKQLSSENTALKAQIESYKDLLTAQKDTVGFQTQLGSVRNQILGIYDELSTSALSLGESLVNAIASGMNKKDFSLELKDYIRQNIIKLNVYGGEMGRTLATAGERLTAAIISQDAAGIKNAKSYMMGAYTKIDSLMKSIDKQLDDIFGVAEKTTATVQKTEESVSSFQRAIKSFKESIADLGGDIANNLVSSLSSGLDVNSALLGFKKFLREYIVKSYVFTESMKGEIEKIGKLIGKTLDGSISKNELSNVANAVKATYGKLAGSMKAVDTLLDSVFGKEAETKTTSSANTVTESVRKIQKAIDNLKDSLKDLGGDVAGNFISSLNNGLDLDSALVSFKKFIRNYVIQSAVYTDSLKSEMEKIGKGIADYVSGKNKSTGLDKISKEFKKTYEKLANDISKADEYLDKLFGKEKEKEVKDTTSTITKELSKIESAMESFKETVSDLGGDIASNLIDGLSNGLSQSDFLTNMKNWIKKMLVQSVVYTESLKGEIEAIGKTITNAISGGFTETTMHEIRRDLSFIFEQATSKMSGIDKVLGGVFDGYATGTTSALSGLHIVGEAGPELVRFKGGERVYNNADTMKMISGAGKTNNMNITFNNVKDTSAFAMMSQLKQYQRELAINGVL